MLHRNQRFAAHHDLALLSEIERYDRNPFQVDVLPDVEFGPVRERKNANAFALVRSRVEQVPNLRALVLGVPLAARIAEGIDALLGARFFFIAARAAKSRVVAARLQRVEQCARFEKSAALLRAELERVRAIRDCFAVGMHQQLRTDGSREAVAEFDHFTELKVRVDVQQRERHTARMESFLRQAHHHRRVFPDRIEHHGIVKLGCDFAQYVDAFGLQRPQV